MRGVQGAMDYQFLEVADDRGLLNVTINRPAKRNALSQGVLAELRRC